MKHVLIFLEYLLVEDRDDGSVKNVLADENRSRVDFPGKE
jgi:hypothetical protein